MIYNKKLAIYNFKIAKWLNADKVIQVVLCKVPLNLIKVKKLLDHFSYNNTLLIKLINLYKF